MKYRETMNVISAMLLGTMLLAGLGCSESSSPEQGAADTTPPKLTGINVLDNVHVEAVFDEEIDKISGEHAEYYAIYLQTQAFRKKKEGLGPVAYGDTLYVSSSVLRQDAKTVLLTFGPPCVAGATYDLVVAHIRDLNGNEMSSADSISFVGTGAFDTTPPEITDRLPAPGAQGVGIGQSVDVKFSEGMLENTVSSAFSWTGPGGDVPFTMSVREANHFVFTPDAPLAYGTQYTVGFAANTASDWGGNLMASSSYWSFMTTNVQDNTPPTVVSTYPADGATGVPRDATLKIMFSEPVNPASIQYSFVFTNPPIVDGLMTWSDGGKTLLFDPDSLLLADTNYSLLVIQGGISDYAGNKLAESYPISFSTGFSFPTGSFSGIVQGDANSPGASDPAGTVVTAALANPTDPNAPDPILMAGFDVAGTGGAYSVDPLLDGTYWPFCVKESNGDGILDPGTGDAVGGFNFQTDPNTGQVLIDSVVITGGNSLANIDLTLVDPTTISGLLTYVGSQYSGSIQNYTFYIGVFDTTGFDTVTVPTPLYGAETNYYNPEYQLNSLAGNLAPGTYYIGAFVDIDGDSSYTPSIDPSGMYEANGFPIAVTVQYGEDAGGIDIPINDPGMLASAEGVLRVKWLEPLRKADRRMVRMLRELGEAARSAAKAK